MTSLTHVSAVLIFIRGVTGEADDTGGTEIIVTFSDENFSFMTSFDRIMKTVTSFANPLSHLQNLPYR
jgi:hypothetical protein